MSGQAQALRATADARQPRVPGARRRDGRDGAAARRPDRAGLSADGRADRDPPARRHPRGARQGRARLPGVPARRDRSRRGPGAASPEPSRRRTSRPRSQAGTRPCDGSPSTSCSRSSSAWSSGAASAVRDAAPEIRVDADADAAVRSAIVAAIGARVGEAVDLTVDQVVAMDAIRDDLARPTPMLRLLQGDVGSGKTAVAAYALAATARAGFQGALLAPTDLLARQHLETVSALLEGVGHRGHAADRLAQGGRARRKALEAIASGQAQVVVGTHALLQDAVSFARPRARGHRRAASIRRRPARRARGEGRRAVAARPADDRDAHPADARPGPVRGPRRVRPADAAGRPGEDPDRRQATGRSRRRRGRRSARRPPLGHRTFVVVPLIEEGADDGDGAVAAESEAVRLRGLLAPAASRAWSTAGSSRPSGTPR